MTGTRSTGLLTFSGSARKCCCYAHQRMSGSPTNPRN